MTLVCTLTLRYAHRHKGSTLLPQMLVLACYLSVLSSTLYSILSYVVRYSTAEAAAAASKTEVSTSSLLAPAETVVRIQSYKKRLYRYEFFLK